MNLAVVGIGDVGLVTGVTLAEMGHYVTFVDTNEAKVEKMMRGIFPIFDPYLSELIGRNMDAGRLMVTSNHEEGFLEADEIYIAVEIPQNEDESANLSYVDYVATTIALTAKKDTIVVTKSTVPVGTNDRLLQIIDQNKLYHINIEVVSYPELLQEVSEILYNPISAENAKRMLEYATIYVDKMKHTIGNLEVTFVLNEWDKPHLQASLGSW